MEGTKFGMMLLCIGRRVRACTRLSEALAKRNHVRGISGLSALSNRMCSVGVKTEHTSRKRQKVLVSMELHRAIIYTTKMSKQVTKSHVRDAVQMYPVN
jgi:hypothetical protein